MSNSRPSGQRPEQVADCERHEVVGGVRCRDLVEVQQHEPVREEDRVVQERLRDHQRGAEDRTARVVAEEHPQQGQVTDLVGRPDLDLPARVHWRQVARRRRDIVLDLADRPFGCLLPAVHDLPARALRQVAPDEDDHQREHRADQERDPPAPHGGDVVERHDCHDGAEEGAGPVGAVDGEVHPAAVLGGDHLVDRRVDRRVLTADAHARDDTRRVQEDKPVAAGRRYGGQAAADQVDAERDHEQVLAPELVRQPAEEQGADDLADQVPPGDVGHGTRGHVERVVQRQVGADVAGDGDFEPVEDPGDPESYHQPCVEP